MKSCAEREEDDRALDAAGPDRIGEVKAGAEGCVCQNDL